MTAKLKFVAIVRQYVATLRATVPSEGMSPAWQRGYRFACEEIADRLEQECDDAMPAQTGNVDADM